MDTPLEGPGWRCLWDAHCDLGESPIWDAARGLVWFVDIERSIVHRFDPATGEKRDWTAPCRVGAIGLHAGGGFVAGTKLGFAFLDPDLDAFEVIDHPEPDFPTNRFNDGKVDPHGNFWAGTMDDLKRDRSGVLYRLGSDHRWVGIDPGYRISNGPAFSPDGGTLYHTDTLDRTTYAFDLADDGSVSNRRVFREWRDVSGNPDGMTTDAEGHLWVAFWGGWCVRRVTPAGEVVAEHALPVSNVTSMAFGGPGLDRLFVTCAHQELDADAAAVQPLAGALFEVLGHGVTGLPGGIYRG